MGIKHIIIISLLFLAATILSAEEITVNGFGIGINYPGFGVKYGFGNKIIELRTQTLSEKTDTTDESTASTALRFYKYISDLIYFGGELSSFTYTDNNDNFKTAGIVAGVYAGVEKFFSDKFSVNIDLGPYYAQTTSETPVTLMDFVLNLSINCYFGSVDR
jgi:hypothetical protein